MGNPAGGCQDLARLGRSWRADRKRRRSDNESEGNSAIQFSDHTDVRPTMMARLGLRDDYTHDRRVLIEALEPSVIPNTIADHYSTLLGHLGLTSGAGADAPV
jgi:hypothetical protein